MAQERKHGIVVPQERKREAANPQGRKHGAADQQKRMQGIVDPQGRNQSIADLQAQFNDLDKEIERLFTKAAAKAGLSESAFDILYAFAVYGDGCSQKELCDRCWLGKQTVHSSVKRLAEQGVVNREQGPGKESRITLTDSGRKILHQKVLPIVNAEATALEKLGLRKQREFVEMLALYRDALLDELSADQLV